MAIDTATRFFRRQQLVSKNRSILLYFQQLFSVLPTAQTNRPAVANSRGRHLQQYFLYNIIPKHLVLLIIPACTCSSTSNRVIFYVLRNRYVTPVTEGAFGFVRGLSPHLVVYRSSSLLSTPLTYPFILKSYFVSDLVSSLNPLLSVVTPPLLLILPIYDDVYRCCTRTPYMMYRYT